MILNGAAPGFALGEAGLALALIRAVSVAGLLQVAGALLFQHVVAPKAWGRAEPQTALSDVLDRIIGWSLAMAIAAMLLRLISQTAGIAAAGTLPATFAALPVVLAETRFGHLVALQLACLIAACVVRRGVAALIFAGLALALQSGHGHAASMQPASAVLLASDIVHLLAAGGWLGCLLPLLLMVRHAPPAMGAAMCRHYTPLGKLCVVALLATAAIQFNAHIGGVAGLLGTAYGWMALAKMALFGALFGFACRNRYRLAPALRGPDAGPSRRRLIRSIAWQTAAGLAVVIAASLLSQLPPAMHTQPVWPFTVQFSLLSLREDPDLRWEVLQAAGFLVLAMMLACIGLIRRRHWLALLVLAVPLAAAQARHLDILFIPATPESFYISPTEASAQSIAAGARLYSQHCAACHGEGGQGDGMLAKSLPVSPADLTAPHLLEHSDGELFGWLAHGIANPQGGLSMPGFAGTLSDDDIWALIDLIRARNPNPRAALPAAHHH